MEFNKAFSNSKSRLFITTLLPPTPEEVLFHRNTLYLIKFVLSIFSLPVKILPGQFSHFLHYEAAQTLFSPILNGNMMTGAVAAAFQPWGKCQENNRGTNPGTDDEPAAVTDYASELFFLMRKIIPYLCKSLFLSLVLFVATLNPNWWGPGTVYFCSAELEIQWCTLSIHFPWHHSLRPWTLGATSPPPQHTYTASSLPGWDPWICHRLCLPKPLGPHSIYISKSDRSQSPPG